MHYYRFPKWLKWFYREAIWDFSSNDQPTIYLTFDDGPNRGTTQWILDLLDQYDAKATFFCVGKNAVRHPKMMTQMRSKGHRIGNHTNTHLNGWKTRTNRYVTNVAEARRHIDSDLFRPPYGKLNFRQFKRLKSMGFKVVFWSHISYDFDAGLAKETRLKKLIERTQNGSIVVFHDSDKAFPQLKDELPELMETWHQAGYRFKAIYTS